MASDRTRRRMAVLVRQWERSGEPRRVFAARHGLTIAQFDYWKWQVRRHAIADNAVRFAPVQVVDSPAACERVAIEVVLQTGEHLMIPEGASIDLVRAVVMALRATC